MAHRAVGQATGGVDPVLPNEFKSFRFLVGRWQPMQVVNLGTRADIILRRAVTFETPLHVEGLGASGERHLIEGTVTGRATDTFSDMDAVIEEDKVRQIVYPIPLDRSVGRQAVTHGLKERSFRPDLGVAGHADLRARYPGEGRFFHRRVAVATVYAVIPHVMFVTERHRLLER